MAVVRHGLPQSGDCRLAHFHQGSHQVSVTGEEQGCLQETQACLRS
jgi:hypothetical protein